MASFLTNTQYKLSEVADFCYANQNDLGYKLEDWQRMIVAAANNKTLYVAANDNTIIGASIAEKLYDQKMMYVYEIVCIKDGFWSFVQAVEEDHPDWGFIGMRKNKKQFIGGSCGQR